MKTIILLALVLGLSTVSCKKEAQTAESANTDTIPTMDSMNTNTAPADTMTNQSPISSDSANANIQAGDSAAVTP